MERVTRRLAPGAVELPGTPGPASRLSAMTLATITQRCTQRGLGEAQTWLRKRNKEGAAVKPRRRRCRPYFKALPTPRRRTRRTAQQLKSSHHTSLLAMRRRPQQTPIQNKGRSGAENPSRHILSLENRRTFIHPINIHQTSPSSMDWGFPCGSVGKESACNVGDLGSIPGLGRSPGERKGYPLQYSHLENPMDCTVHGVTNLDTTD